MRFFVWFVLKKKHISSMFKKYIEYIEIKSTEPFRYNYMETKIVYLHKENIQIIYTYILPKSTFVFHLTIRLGKCLPKLTNNNQIVTISTYCMT